MSIHIRMLIDKDKTIFYHIDNMNIKDPKKHDKILKAATKLIVSNGLADISTTAIAKKIGIAQSNIYLYFKNKRDLLQQVYLVAVNELSLYANRRVAEDSSLLIKMEQYTRALYDFSIERPNTISVIDIIQRSSNIKIGLTESQKGLANQKIQRLLRESASSQILRTSTVEVPRALIFNTIYFYAKGITNRTIDQKDTSLDTVVKMIMAAILKPESNSEWLKNV
ncbi:TetR/AcrR family transcriptional regulator [Oenococcus sp. UCMA 17063]|nr:TetR/AcrR family transcriptional regulator [Oenococcus sp. UCMA 17063]